MLETLKKLKQKCGHRTIIGGDINAFSTRWGSKKTNNKGKLVEEFIDNEQLVLINKNGQPYTFSGPRGENNIDVTLTTQDLSAKVKNWSVLDGIITSDHRLIYYEIGEGTTFSKLIIKKRYVTKKADWEKFNRELVMQTQLIYNQDSDLESRTESIMQAITRASDKAIPKQKQKRKVAPPWWTNELESKKKIMRAAYRKIEGDEEGKQQRRAVYNRERNQYVKTLRTEKKLSWRKFASEINDNTWGKCFRWIKKGSANREAPSVLKRQDGEYTKTLEETLKYLLDTLIPTEDTGSEQEEPPYREQSDYSMTNKEEVKNSIWRMSTKKAPGEDGINAMILRNAWPIMGDLITNLFNDLLRNAYFPKIWRNADIVTILKGKDKKREDPKSFRPVSLLPVLGKSLEHLVCTRLHEETETNMANGQHGFKKGRSTLTAISEVIEWVNLREETYVMGVFLDISGAFDNVRWEPLIQDMTNLGASRATIKITESYLRNRTAKIKLDNTTVTKTLTKGCPQGSGFGPSLWNITVNQILATEREEHTHRVAYADDIVALIAGNTRKELVSRTEAHIEDLCIWANRYGLSFSMTKTMGMVLKGTLAPGFYLKFGDGRIKTVEKLKYLGVEIDQELKYKTQAMNIVEKSTVEFSRLRGIMGAEWGLSFETALILYRAIYIPRVTYAACIWMQDWNKTTREKMIRSQRTPLLAVSGAYNTTSTDALQVITGLLPLDLQIMWEGTKQEYRRGKITLEAQEELKDNIIQIWQDRWSISRKGEWTRRIIPNIRTRLDTPLYLNHYITQYLSGHGDFAAKLSKLGLKDTPNCACGQGTDDPEHSIFHCNRWMLQREHLVEAVLSEGENWPCQPDVLIKTRRIYDAFVSFAKTTLIEKSDVN
ncbi:unnamed protein product [Macrosiphum euphorbiae]|uniref:Reverse transcriptase domain-containing protein n=1 Tax=Macrosiphum euphorbiae TaxID=13131 RepID=A0AAV0Y462_9HEMI|nr:unnamed protein product [Macrosiphum euphorbiae]CAI6374226.1 unnamed protein product [Macrosiphum euphorbiae]CAI6375007.1 unnamed protein product [Macrosiphum euphorbiae]